MPQGTYRSKPIPQFAKTISCPVGHKGINAISSLAEMDPEECIYAYNLIATQAGMQVRPGYSEWCKNMAGSGGVRTIIPVRGNASANDKLFACTIDGIYDCTATSSAPTLVVTFGLQTGNAGWGSWEHCTNSGADEIVCYCDEVNGYYTYDTNTSTWLKVTMGTGAGQVSNIDPATFSFVRLFNNFLWFVQASSGNSWYLPVGQIYGAATVFSYGNKFGHGGNLNSLWTFTYGSYFGTFLYLVGIGDSGDVVAYTGNNPASSTSWTMSGQWYIGDIVPGRRCATNYGGDLTILCSYGAVNLSSLFYQKDLSDPNTFITKKIAPAIKSEISSNQVRGWEIVPWPGGNALLVLDPNYLNTYQFCYCLATNGWTVFRNFPMQTAVVWHGNLYAGTADGRVVIATGGQDNVKIGNSNGVAVQWGALGAFSNLQMPGTDKFVDLVRPYFITDQPIPFNIFTRFDFDITDLVLGSGVGSLTPAMTGWDSGIWDSSVWGASSLSPQVSIMGQTGTGHWCAMGILGASLGNTTHITYDVSFRPTKGFM